MFRDREYESKIPSIGGNVADFLGTLSERAEQTHHESMNLDGNLYRDISVREMVDRFASMFPRDLDILAQRLDDFCGVLTFEKKPEELNPTYQEARQVLQDRLQQMREGE